MEAYTSFAEVYDMFMDNVPYEQWVAFLCSYLKKHGIADGLVADLGCGTGKMTRLMARAGYDMIGVDNSMEMLEIARDNDSENILYLMQDMREFELYGTVRAIYSACDSMNYLLEEEDILAVLRLANNYLDPGGLFLFDLNTPFKYRELLGENTFAENREEGSFIWENYFDEESEVNEYDLTLFIREDGTDTFSRFRETHYQRCYSTEQIKRLVEEAGMEFVEVMDAYSGEPLREDSEKMLFVVREKRNPDKLYVDNACSN